MGNDTALIRKSPRDGAHQRRSRARSARAQLRPLTLAGQILHGAEHNDPVQLHGAIASALDLHGVADAVEHILMPCIRSLNGAAEHRASVAMGAHLRDRLRTGA